MCVRILILYPLLVFALSFRFYLFVRFVFRSVRCSVCSSGFVPFCHFFGLVGFILAIVNPCNQNLQCSL